MPTSKYFDRCPAFPTDVPFLDVPVVSYQRLQNNDAEAVAQLFAAMREYGFFTLDLNTCDEGRAFIHDAESMFDLSQETFDLSRDTLDQYSMQMSKGLLGYKSTGQNAAGDGFKDALDTFMFGQDDVLGTTSPPLPKPQPVGARLTQCQSFCRRAHTAATVILDSLDASLGLPRGTLISLCPLDKVSQTGVRMLRAQPSKLHSKQMVSGGAHTDIGVITLLFNIVGGLQIRPAEIPETDPVPWRFIRPRQGCVIINAGDTLVEWTGGVFRSSLHRVHRPPGAQADTVRFSLAYPLRPARDGSMRRLRGSPLIPSLNADETDEARSPDEWASWRVEQLREGRYQPKTLGGIPMSLPAVAVV